MWEEHPKHQKHQALMIGVGLIVILVLYVGLSIVSHDWDSLRQILLFAGAFLIALSLVFCLVWTMMKIFTRKQADDSKIEDSHDA
jgi:protein-S-isoprenylcysteine O-methyltransferase Ste14